MLFDEITIGPCRLILADCRDVLPALRDSTTQIDAAVTDPPYGIGFDYGEHDDNEQDWFSLMDQVVPVLRSLAPFVVMPNCRMQAMRWWMEHHEPNWIVAWYKGSPGHLSKIGFSSWEPHLVWGKPPKPMHDYFQTALIIEENGHPCPKPIAWSNWLVSRATKFGGTVLDPFMGSGTTGKSCVKLGRNFIGIEKDPNYFRIACDGIRKAVNESKFELPLDVPKIKFGLEF